VYVELHSGFGNQIFQYALALSLQDEYNFDSYILPSRGNTHSKQNYQELFTLVKHSTDNNVPRNAINVNKKDSAFDSWDVTTLRKYESVKLCGYYQNYKLFKNVVPKIAIELSKNFEKLYGTPTWNPVSTGFIHVRRDDYFLAFAKMYNLQMDYYNEAIDRIQTMNPGIRWIIVSDEIEWCKKQEWKTTEPVSFFESKDELKAFWCMLNCRAAAITANSTFSYWAALLASNISKFTVIYPNAWHLETTPDIFPEDWVGVGSREKSLKIYK
jgi:hypothetical protein